MNNAQHRSGNADIISFAGEKICFHEQAQKYDALGKRISS